METVVIKSGRVLQILALGTSDRCEYLSFVADLEKNEPKTAAKLQARIDYSAENGIPKDIDKCRKLVGTEEIWELKANQSRVLWFFIDSDGSIVISHGFTKKTQKTPRNQIERAEGRRRAYLAGEDVEEDESNDQT